MLYLKLNVFIIFIFFWHTILKCQDTMVIKILDLPFHIRSMANDEKGQIFIESSNGLYQFNGSKYWLIDPNYNKGTLYFYHGKLTNQIEFNKKYIEFSGDWQKNAIWHPFIPGSAPNLISHARDKSGHEFLASNNQIFKVELLNKFQTLQKGYSTRGMSFINNEFYINTYRGIFRNRTRILPHIVFADDLFYQKKDSTILFSTNSNLIKYYPQNGESKIIDLSSLGEKNYISRIIEYKGNIFIGTQKGFIDFKNRKHIGKNLEINDLDEKDKKILELVNILDVWRADDYNNWFNVGRCLYNTNNEYINIFNEFSKRSSNKYESSKIIKIWADYKNIIKNQTKH